MCYKAPCEFLFFFFLFAAFHLKENDYNRSWIYCRRWNKVRIKYYGVSSLKKREKRCRKFFFSFLFSSFFFFFFLYLSENSAYARARKGIAGAATPILPRPTRLELRKYEKGCCASYIGFQYKTICLERSAQVVVVSCRLAHAAFFRLKQLKQQKRRKNIKRNAWKCYSL